MTVEMKLRADDPKDLPALAEYALKRLGESRCACAGDGSYCVRRQGYECSCFRVRETEIAESGPEAVVGSEGDGDGE